MTRYNNTVAINQNLSARLCLKKAFRELQIAEMIFQTRSRPMIDMEYKKKNNNYCCSYYTGDEGFEPPSTVLETGALPLN